MKPVKKDDLVEGKVYLRIFKGSRTVFKFLQYYKDDNIDEDGKIRIESEVISFYTKEHSFPYKSNLQDWYDSAIKDGKNRQLCLDGRMYELNKRELVVEFL